MNKYLRIFLFFFVSCSDFGTNPKPNVNLETKSYKNDIQPMLHASCINCHGNRGELSVRTYDKLMEGSKTNGPVVIPNDGEGSLIIQKLRGAASGDRMPPAPADPWEETKIEILIKWINQGALNN